MPLTGLTNAHMNRTQFLCTSLDLWLSKTRLLPQMSVFACLSQLLLIDLSSSSLVQLAVDVMSLVQTGAFHGDERCMQEACALYTKALPMLSREITKPAAQQIPKDVILAVIIIFASCEYFEMASNAKSASGIQSLDWTKHVQGTQQDLQVAGKDVMTSSLDQALFHHHRHNVLVMGILQRKAAVLDQPQWIRLAQTSKTDPYIRLYNILLQLPGLMERGDKLVANSKASTAEFSKLIAYFCSQRTMLDDWKKPLVQQTI